MDDCKLCFNKLTLDTFVMYRLNENDDYKSLIYCIDCLNEIKETQWQHYINAIKTADCEKSLINLIKSKPPIHFRDTYIENNKEIYDFLYKGEPYSSRLKGALTNEKCEELHIQLLNAMTGHIDYINVIHKILSFYDI